MKITFETTDASEARALLDTMEGRATTPATTAPVATTPAVSEPTTTVERTPEPPVGDEVLDCHGMRWDETIHASTKQMTDKGAWKVRKGSADAAKAAIAAHKAAGNGTDGNPVTPTNEQRADTGGGMPTGAAPAGGMPAGNAATPPVTQEVMEAKVMRMFGDGSLSQDDGSWTAALERAGVPVKDPSAATEANETLRAALYAELLAIQPE